MNQLGGFPILTLIVFLPALGAILSLLVSPSRPETRRWVALLIAATDAFVALFLYMGWTNDLSGGAQFVDGPWPLPGRLGGSYHLGVDGLNLYLVLSIAFLTPLAFLLAWSRTSAQPYRESSFIFGTLVLETGMLGAVTAFDLWLLAGFCSCALLAMLFVLGAQERAGQTTAHFAIVAATASALLLTSTAIVSVLQPGTDLADLLANPLPWQAQAWLFWAMVLAFGLLGAIWPLHLWYPDAHRHSSPAVRLLMSTLFVNLGSYGLMRFGLLLFPLAADGFAPALILVGSAGLIYGAVAALGQENLVDTLAYWNVAQGGWTIVGILTLQNLGLHGAIMHTTARSLSLAALLIMCAEPQPNGANRASSQPDRWLDRTALALAFLSAIGVPGLAGFGGQATLILGVLGWHWQASPSPTMNRALDGVFYAALTIAILIGTWALLRAWRKMLRPAPHFRAPGQVALAIPLLVLILALGLRPGAVSDMIGPSVHRLLLEFNASLSRSLLQMGAPPTESPEPGPPLPDGQASDRVWRATSGPFLSLVPGAKCSQLRPRSVWRIVLHLGMSSRTRAWSNVLGFAPRTSLEPGTQVTRLEAERQDPGPLALYEARPR
jgi:NADH-quinone oxidoreductase subunit M